MAFQGVFSVLPTPFTPDDRVDAASLKRVVDLGLSAGVDGFTALGVTSEVDKLGDSERSDVLETIMTHVAGRVPVVVGATANGLATCTAYVCRAAAAGATAVMVSPPRLVKLNSDAVFRHFAALAEMVDIPIVVQDYPPISGYTMEPALLARIVREIPQARTVKLEDAPTPLKISQIIKLLGDIPVSIFGGLGGTYLLEELLAGACGAMTGFAYPEVLVDVVRRFRSGDRAGAADLFHRFVTLMRFEFQPVIGMAIRKEIYHRRGAIAHPVVRQPGAGLDDGTREALDTLLRWIKQTQEVTWI